jgi:hypothetical protein
MNLIIIFFSTDDMQDLRSDTNFPPVIFLPIAYILVLNL